MKHNRRADMPTQRVIRAFWSNTSLWRFKGFDSRAEFLEADYCFACGFTNGESKTERAHIVALSTGGTNECENLHLLCGRCHIDSELLGSPSDDPFQAKYWRWLFSRTYDDRCMSAAIAAGFNPSDFTNGDEHLFEVAQQVFADRPDILKRITLFAPPETETAPKQRSEKKFPV
jgi:hypothetical protein